MCSCFSHFSLFIHHLHSCTLAIFKWNTCARRALLLVLLLILPICPSWSMPTALMALFRSILLIAIQIFWATLFLKAHEWWVLFHCCYLSFLFLHPNTCSNKLFFKFNPLFRCMRTSFGLREISNWSWLSIPNSCIVARMSMMMMMRVMMVVMVVEV